MATKEQQRAWSKAYRERHPERQKAATKKWRDKNKERYREKLYDWRRRNPDRVKSINKSFHNRNPEYKNAKLRDFSKTDKGKYGCLKHVCLRTGRELGINFEEYIVIVAKPCWYCGGDLPSVGYGIDRIDSNQGYTIENCRPCCKVCNIMKSNMSEDEFYSHIKKISKHQEMVSE